MTLGQLATEKAGFRERGLRNRKGKKSNTINTHTE